MPIVPLTLTISLCLVFTFAMFFLCEHARGRVSSSERDSLLPLAEEAPGYAGASAPHDAVSRGCGPQSANSPALDASGQSGITGRGNVL